MRHGEFQIFDEEVMRLVRDKSQIHRKIRVKIQKKIYNLVVHGQNWAHRHDLPVYDIFFCLIFKIIIDINKSGELTCQWNLVIIGLHFHLPRAE